MTLTLPQPIDAYFTAANGTDPDAIAAWFADDAKVRDEGRDYRGRSAIRAWAQAARRKYRFHAAPRTVERDGDALVVLAHLTGDFPGAPADLRYQFELKDDRIDRLRITPADAPRR